MVSCLHDECRHMCGMQMTRIKDIVLLRMQQKQARVIVIVPVTRPIVKQLCVSELGSNVNQAY